MPSWLPSFTPSHPTSFSRALRRPPSPSLLPDSFSFPCFFTASGETHGQATGVADYSPSSCNHSCFPLLPSSSNHLRIFVLFLPQFRRPVGSNGDERRLQRWMMLGRGKSFDLYFVLCAMLPSKVDSCFSLSSLDFHSAHPYDYGSDEFSGEDVLRQAMPSWIKLR